MKVLVVGGAGYIGSVTVEQLVAAGHDVIVLDNLSRGHAAAVVPQATLLVGDLADETFLESVFSQNAIDAVMHFSASSQVGESVTDPLAYYQNNISNGARLVAAMIRHEVKRFVFSSTAATFGEPRSLPIREDDPKEPTNPYGRTKLFFERFLADCDTAYQLKSICLRYFNAAGASERLGEDHHPETHLIPIVLDVATGKRDSVAVFGTDYPTRDGTCVRDYIHVIDLAQAHILALEYLMSEKTSDYFNLGNGDGYTVMEVIDAVERITGKPVKRRMDTRRAGDPASLVASSEKIRTRLGWNPRYPKLDQIVESAWKWKLAHPDGYADRVDSAAASAR